MATPGANGFVTVIIMELLMTVFPLIQVPFEVRVQLIKSPLTTELSL